MNNNARPGDAQPVPACLIGDDVVLVAPGSDSRWQADFPSGESGRVELSVMDRDFVAVQCSRPIEPGDLPKSLDLCDDLIAFATAAGLPRERWGSFLLALLGPVTEALGLADESRLSGLVRKLMANQSLPRGRLVAEAVSGIGTALLPLPRSLGLAPGDMLVSADRTVSAGVVKDVRAWLGGSRAGRIAAIAFDAPPASGTFLAAYRRGLAVVDLDVERHDGTVAFHERHFRTAPELVNLLALSDEEAAVELGVLARRSSISPVVADDVLGFRFELSDVLPMPHGLFVHGWFFDPDGRLEGIAAVDYGLRETSVTRAWQCVAATHGTEGERRRVTRFTAFLPRRKGGKAPGNTAFRLGLAGAEQYMLQAPAGAQDDLSRRGRILAAIAAYDFSSEAFRRIFKPALGPLQAKINRRQSIRKRFSFGTLSARSASIVVPLYRETRFIRSQLMAFAGDAHVRSTCEIVYVVDDPLIALQVEQELRDRAELHTLDLRLVVLERNGGYALANNFGVGEAQGETVVLMNSDVVPEGSGWLEPLEQSLDALPPGSVVGPKLLYADGSLQHAGMYFERQANGRWQNRHCFKGYARDFGPANVERDVPALTGALMVLRRADYLAVGGFDQGHVIGDYEDSDLCLKLRARGGRCRYVPAAVLRHFERQSMPSGEATGPTGPTLYNEALHDARWSSAIAALMKDFAEVPDGG